MEVRVETETLTCRSCGRDLEPGSARRGHHPPAPIETGYLELRGLPELPHDHPAPWWR
jgi:hypothetical protein